MHWERQIHISFIDGSNAMDADMMDTEAASSAAAPPHQQEHNDIGKDLLTMARNLTDQGKPSQALQAVVIAMRTERGDEAVFQSLNRAREVYRTRMQGNTAVDQLASLFAECAIAEALPLNAAESLPNNPNGPPVASDVHGTSILAETGRMQILSDAFSDGSSFICLQCGGLVSNHRKDEHYAYWCGNMLICSLKIINIRY